MPVALLPHSENNTTQHKATVCDQLKHNTNKKLSCRSEAARRFVFVCSQLQHTYSAVFLLLATAASDLLVHKILLNSVLLSPTVSGSVRPRVPGQTPLGHNPPCFLPFVGRLGSGPSLATSA